MKKLYLLTILSIVTTGSSFGMDNQQIAGQKRTLEELEQQIKSTAKKPVFHDSDDEAPKATNHDGFKEKIEERLSKREMYNARCNLQDWVKFCAKNNTPIETANHIPVMWEFYTKIEEDAAKNGYKEKIQRSTTAPLAILTRSCGLNPDDYKNQQTKNQQEQL